jgi:hypothetical protein
MKRGAVLFLGLLGLGGCQTVPVAPNPPVDGGCRYPERDLTVPWAQRVYWCRPDRPVAPEIPFCVGDACG